MLLISLPTDSPNMLPLAPVPRHAYAYACHRMSIRTWQVEVVLDQFKNEVLLPEESLIPVPGGGDAVFIVENGITVAMPVTILGRNAGRVAVRGVEA